MTDAWRNLTTNRLSPNLRSLRRTLFTGLLILFASLALDGAGLLASAQSLTSLDSQPLRLRQFSDLSDVEQLDADEPQIEFEHILPEDGLASSSVYWITEDRLGFIWIGTSGGLNRYDGRLFQTYRHEPDDPASLSEDHVFNVLEDHLGNLWVGTYGGGLERFDRDLEQFIHYQFDPTKPDSIRNNKIFTLYEDRAGTLWVGTSGGGLERYDRETDGFVHYQHDPDSPASIIDDFVNIIYEDRSGALWIGTTNGLDRLDRQTGQFTHFQHDPENPQSLSNNQVFAIIEDSQGMLWVGTSGGGLNRLDGDTGQFAHYRHDPDDPGSLSDDIVFVLLEDSAGTLLVGSLGGGLNLFDREQERFIRLRNDPADPTSLSSDSINAMYEDREGTLWIGTTHALDKYARLRQRFDRILEYEFTQTILEDSQGMIWVGTTSGLYQLGRNLEQVASYQHDPGDPGSLGMGWVLSIYEDFDGVLWVGTSGGGLNRLDWETGQFSHYQHDPNDPLSLSNDVVNTMTQKQDGTMWVGTDGGLNLFDPSLGTFRLVPTDPDAPEAARVEGIGQVVVNQEGTLWVGGWGDGLKRLDQDSNRFVVYRHDSSDPASLKTNFVTSLWVDSDGSLWIGTDRGLHRFQPEEDSFLHYTEEDGLQSNLVGAITEDRNGDLWIGSGLTLSRLVPETGSITHYTAERGLHGRHYGRYAVLLDNGSMLFGGSDGIVAFDPTEITSNPFIPPVRLVSLQLHGAETNLEEALETATSVTFAWDDRDFEFEFAALSFVQPKRNSHAYMLEGYDQSWNMVGTERRGRYTSLPGGTYTLRMKGSNNDGLWNEEGTLLKITIVPPIWSTWWFRGGLLLLVVGTALGGYWLRVRSIEARSMQLEREVQERTAELAQTNELLAQEMAERMRAEEVLARKAADDAVIAERGRLARDLHDDVTQTLFSASLIAEALPTLWESDPREGRELLSELRMLNRGAMAEMRTLLLELRPASLAQADLGDLLRQLADAFIGRTGATIAVSADDYQALPSEVRIALYRIAQEALNNIVKHAKASHVELNLSHATVPPDVDRKTPHRVELRVSDDGRGFDPAAVQPGHHGLSIIRERASAVGADLTIESQPDQGTEIVVMWEERQ